MRLKESLNWCTHDPERCITKAALNRYRII